MRTNSVIALILATGVVAGCHRPDPPSNPVDTGPLLRYDLIGSGPPLLLLHGFGGCAAVWDPFDSTLATRYELIIPDLPGHGGSPRPSGPYTTRSAVQEVLRLLDSLHLRQVRAIGASAGAITLLHAAVERPDLFDRMILVSGAHTIPPEGRARLHAMTSLQAFPPPVAEGWRGCAEGRIEQVDWLLTQLQRFDDDTTDVHLSAQELQRITARTLIVHGDQDPLIPVAVPIAMQQAIPRSSLWRLPDGDHVPIYGATTRPFLDSAMVFLADP